MKQHLAVVASFWLALLLLIGLMACGEAATRGAANFDSAASANESSAPTSDATTTKSIEHLATPTDSAVAQNPSAKATTGSSNWKTYISQRGGFSIDYPANWQVNEQVGSEANVVVTFAPTNASFNMQVLVKSTETVFDNDIPNVRCEKISLNGLAGTRCFDTISFSTNTSLSARAKTFVLSTVGKRPDLQVYERMLSSFRLN